MIITFLDVDVQMFPPALTCNNLYNKNYLTWLSNFQGLVQKENVKNRGKCFEVINIYKVFLCSVSVSTCVFICYSNALLSIPAVSLGYSWGECKPSLALGTLVWQLGLVTHMCEEPLLCCHLPPTEVIGLVKTREVNLSLPQNRHHNHVDLKWPQGMKVTC